MNGREIKKIQLLRKVYPNDSLLTEIKNDIDRKIYLNQNYSKTTNNVILPSLGTFGFFSLGLACVVLSIIFLQPFFHTTLLSVELMLASNQYERAVIALEDLKENNNGKRIFNKPSPEVASELAMVNTELSKLALKGEAGNYSMKDCQNAYKIYIAYLKNELNVLPNTSSYEEVRMQITSYEEVAEKRLHLYTSL